jgi:Asp-tRNA(Asn)/Glu-tRNA(Gln) amidotransferase C subunit
MSDSKESSFSPADIAALAKAARLPLTEARREAIAPVFSGVLASFDTLDAVDLGETPPTNSFDPRWRDLK